MTDENDTAARLRELLRRESDTLQIGPPPLAEVTRAGRRMRRRRRMAAGGAFVVVLSIPLGLATLPRLEGERSRTAASPVTARSPERLVEAHEAHDIGRGLRIGLQPSGRPGHEGGQGYVLVPAAQYERAIGQLAAGGSPRVAGDGLAYDLSIFLTPWHGSTVVSGTWRTPDNPPEQVRITTDAGERPATLVRVSGTENWGVYYSVLENTGAHVDVGLYQELGGPMNAHISSDHAGQEPLITGEAGIAASRE